MTLNWPNPYYTLVIKYKAKKYISCSFSITFDNIYIWYDIADLHPDQYWPDSWLEWARRAGVGTPYHIMISWREKSIFKHPSGKPPIKLGWPWD